MEMCRFLRNLLFLFLVLNIEPARSVHKVCMSSKGVSGLLNSLNDSIGKGCLTSKKKDPRATVTGCPNGWVYYQNSCYVFMREIRVLQLEAQVICRGVGGYIVQPETEAENNFIKNYLQQISGSDNDWWIGLHDREVEGTYNWHSTGQESTFFDWHTGQPNDSGPFGEDCAKMKEDDNFEWYDDACYEQNSVMCERPVSFKHW